MSAIEIDRAVIARMCAQYGVARLRLFGSAVTDSFDPQSSDLDFLVDFASRDRDRFVDYFGLKDSLETEFGRSVDLVVTESIKNPYFLKSALANTEELYAA